MSNLNARPATFETDARRRATLPSLVPANSVFTVEDLHDGTYRLVPVELVPKHQLWALQPHVQKAVQKASREKGVTADSAKGRQFLKALEEK